MIENNAIFYQNGWVTMYPAQC